MTDPTEWRSGPVTVSSSGLSWWVDTPDSGSYIAKALFRDPQELADLIASRLPKPKPPRYRVATYDDRSLVRDNKGTGLTIANFYPPLDHAAEAQRLADELNAREAES